MARKPDVDVVLAGGGLANLLIAYRLSLSRPDVRIALIERGERLGGNHTWSFHTTDLSSAQYTWMQPLLSASWAQQDVAFPRRRRTIDVGYNSIASEKLAAIVAPMVKTGLHLSTQIAAVDETGVTLADQRRITGRCVIDGRGISATPHLALGYQKFLGLEVETSVPHGLTRPIIMDATVSQRDGYRFVYTLPFSPTRLLIEDTYYADGAKLDEAGLRSEITRYAADRGWSIAHIVREEHGVLPVVLAGDIDAFWRDKSREGAAPVGLAAALVHPTTGYSLPLAVEVADRIAQLPDLTTAAASACVERYARETWEAQKIYRFLNRMLFLAAEPNERVEVMQHFYRLPADLISRFYAGRLTALDKARILIGRPPIPVPRAMSVLPTSAAWRRVDGGMPTPRGSS
jgi:lycopene beta-cyclase